jgi:hypothetical protein
MSEYDWRDGTFSYRTASEPERYRIVAKIEGVSFVSRETYNYVDAKEIAESVAAGLRNRYDCVGVVRKNDAIGGT